VSNNKIQVATFNTHKGLSSFNLRLTMHAQRMLIRKLRADILFLQEISGAHDRHRNTQYHGQYQYLAEDGWAFSVYGKNATRKKGHHGNAIFSKYPIVRWENVDISENLIEQRGFIHAEIEIPGWNQHLHCICVHLGLLARWRARQLNRLTYHVQQRVPGNAPLIVAGDFNDWRQKAGHVLGLHDMHEVFEKSGGSHAKSFPSVLPIFRLDRIYTRGFDVSACQVHHDLASANMSDHVALSASLLMKSHVR
jgi:endonuclease/exonuclease/phosphatase family metal-dependent hydrolase